MEIIIIIMIIIMIIMAIKLKIRCHKGRPVRRRGVSHSWNNGVIAEMIIIHSILIRFTVAVRGQGMVRQEVEA